ncbi:MAG TPA: dihydroorotate dehydrogenase [Dehalococcoidales bacterium]|nr:dihydroorotate dehydrogenase [Dehalococcoidales bacterium]
MNLAVETAPRNKTGLSLKNPLITASGTFGYGTEFEHLYDIQELGAIVCKGIFLQPRAGNPQPRITETASGILNAIGLQGIGVEALIREKAPIWAKWRVPVVVNIAGNSIEEYGLLARRLDGVPGISGLEVNISCPNLKCGGVEFGTDPEAAAAVTGAVRRSTSLPVWVKLTPNTHQVVKIAQAVTAAGADAIVLINTLKGMAIDVKTRQPVLGNITGGLSGPAIKPVALRMVYEVAGAVKEIPVIGCGGIMTATDALEFILAGAAAVQIGSANLVNPHAPMQILAGLKKYLQENNCRDIRDLIGLARR